MAKKENGALNGAQQVNEKQVASSKRMQVLSKHISEAIQKADEEIEGEFTFMEVMFVMNQNIKHYAVHGLNQEWK